MNDDNHTSHLKVFIGLLLAVLIGVAGYVYFSGGLKWNPDVNGISICPVAERVVFSGKEKGSSYSDVFAACLMNDLYANLTNNHAESAGPALSPDGSKIAYHDNRDGSWEIFLFDLKTATETKLTETEADSMYPSFSPTGENVVFSSNRGGSWGIYRMASDGSNERQLTDRGDTHPHFSPDGLQIVFTSARLGNGQLHLYTMDENGRNLRRLTLGGVNSHPVFSRDGSKLVFEAIDETETYGIMEMDMATKRIQQKVLSLSNDRIPVFSLDGNWIIYIAASEQGNSIMKMPADVGLGERVLSNIPVTDIGAATYNFTVSR
jgi:TolB protein